MTRMFFAAALLMTLALAAGCAMCENPFDYEYSAYGGICEDAACGRRAGSIVGGPCGTTVEKMVVSDEDLPNALEPMPAEPMPAMPPEVTLDDTTPLDDDAFPEFGPDTLIVPDDGAAPSLEAPDPDLAPPVEAGPAEVESEGITLPEPAGADDATSLPLGPAADPPMPE